MMRKKTNKQILLSFFISIILFSCKEKGSNENQDNASQTTSEVMDAVKAAPVLYKVLHDTMGLRMLEVTYNPGDSSVMHSHPDVAVYAVEGGSNTFTGIDGSKTERDLKTGMALVMPAQLHSVKNTGSSTLKVILVEVNRPRQTTPMDAASDPSKVAPELYKVVADTLGIRINEVTYNPGQSSAMHYHPDNALYVIEGGMAEFTDKSGNKNTVELKTGTTALRPAETHSVKNVGKLPFKAILVEVNRGQ